MGTQTTHRSTAAWAVGALALVLVLGACSGGTESTSSTSASTATAAASSDPAPAPEPDQPDEPDQPEQSDEPDQPEEPDQPAQPEADCALLEEALGAYFPAVSGFGNAVSSGDPGAVFTAARQLDNVLNGFANGAPGLSDNAKVFIALTKEAARMGIEASESGDVSGLGAAIEQLFAGDEERYLAGQQELDEYVTAQCS